MASPTAIPGRSEAIFIITPKFELKLHLQITGLRASTSNSAEAVLDMFIRAIQEHGIPSRVRGDRGGENRDVSILMILLRGLRRASFMWGSSVFNTRIERLWREVGKQFARAWRAFFLRLERSHFLQKKSKVHRWILHDLFLDAINEDCQAFCREWNAHPIAGMGGNFSPNVNAAYHPCNALLISRFSTSRLWP